MQAIIEYENGELNTLVGLQGFGREIAERILEGYDIVKMWLILDHEDPFDATVEEPYWSLDLFWVTREDGKVARLYLNNWHDGTDIWTQIEADYPQAVDAMEDCPESADVIEHHVWDETFRPGDGVELADWIQTVVVEVVEYDGPHGHMLKSFEGKNRQGLIDRAIDWATETIENSGVDTSELDVIVQVGDDEVWSWQEASQ